jgi:hypothetical protein
MQVREFAYAVWLVCLDIKSDLINLFDVREYIYSLYLLIDISGLVVFIGSDSTD